MKKITLLMLVVLTITSQAQNKLLSSITQYTDSNGIFVDNYGSNYEYDSNNNLIAETSIYFNQSESKWEVSSKQIYTYNASNKVTEIIYQNWNSTTNKLENKDKTLNTYTNGNRTESIYQTWNTSSSIWENSEKQVLTFNSNNKPDTGLFYKWVNAQWSVDSRATVAYNTNNKLISVIEESWTNSQFVNSSKTLLSYNSNNQVITERRASWDDFNSIWTVNEQTSYVLDATGNRTSETYTNVSDNTQNRKTEYNYDTSSLMTGFSNPFKNKDGLDYLFQDYPFVNKVLSYNDFTYNTSLQTYYNNSKTTYNYNSAIVLANEKFDTENATISVYPNPTKNQINFQFPNNQMAESIIILDITGKIMLTQSNSSNQVDVSQLSNGMYIIKANSEGKIFTNKFIKE